MFVDWGETKNLHFEHGEVGSCIRSSVALALGSVLIDVQESNRRTRSLTCKESEILHTLPYRFDCREGMRGVQMLSLGPSLVEGLKPRDGAWIFGFLVTWLILPVTYACLKD